MPWWTYEKPCPSSGRHQVRCKTCGSGFWPNDWELMIHVLSNRSSECPVCAGWISKVWPMTKTTADEHQPHPATLAKLRYFKYDHLPEPLRKISRGFAVLAQETAYNPALSGAEVTNALTKLLEAKDCAVRAALPPE